MIRIPLAESPFVSRQGEGLKTGLRTIFVRISGCNLADLHNSPCQYCDTSYAWYAKDAKLLLTVDELKQAIDQLATTTKAKEICLTGGEPLSTHGIDELIYWLKRSYNLSIETNGSLPIWSDNHIMWSMDLKCSSSGNEQYNNYDNLKLLTRNDQVKFVIQNKHDFKFATYYTKARVLFANVIFQPAWGKLSPSKLSSWMDEDNDLSHVRLGSQMHKYWWGKNTRK